MLQECFECLAFVYFIQNRAIYIDSSTGLFFDIQVCFEYPPEKPNLLYYQWLIIRVGVGIHDLYKRKGDTVGLICNSLVTAYVVVCLMFYSDAAFI